MIGLCVEVVGMWSYDQILLKSISLYC